MSHFVLEKSRLVGRKERGRGVAGGLVSEERVATALRGDIGMGMGS